MNSLFRTVGLVLLLWTHPVVAIVMLFFTSTTNGRNYKGWALVKNNPVRLTVEILATAAAVVGFWTFPHFHPAVGQLLALVTGVCMIGPFIIRLGLNCQQNSRA